MKLLIKNWITSLIGTLSMLLGVYLIYDKYEILYIGLSFGIGILLLFAKDTLINVLGEWIKGRFKS